MKLFEVPRNTDILLNGEHIRFHHIDGMYSLCTDSEGHTIHLAAWTDVELYKDTKDETENT
jgi:hypothetical protein